ncbi:hydroxyethylthiazole kinase, partial [Limosilactobacillus fermentum]|uniref:hydroxyethylthiazole kinase n=1 Tax=Limosilactobacillus fermentum TaxID=1613 RepID=UPI0021BEEBA6
MQNAIATIKGTNPIVLTVANNVTPADVANGLNALGASPMMSQTPEEADDMVNIAQAAAINLGTLNPHQRGEMEAVMEAAKRSGEGRVGEEGVSAWRPRWGAARSEQKENTL